MPRDYKRRTTARVRRRKRQAPPGLWLLVVVLVIAFVAVLMWLKRSAPQAPQPVVVQPSPVPNAQVPEPIPPHKPRFEFYNTLPKQQVPVLPPKPEVVKPATPPKQIQPPATTLIPVPDQTNAQYRVQVGSYARVADAERLRAELAFSGIETHIQSVTLAGGKTYHRVMVGPYADQAAAAEMRRQLQAQGYQQPLILKQP
ncbi:MAG: SPOR domain-containing protein [Pseudomonadota bacterium]